jgi:hypothetical protein
VHLAAGQSKRVKFTLVPNRDMTYYSETAKAYQVDGGSYELQLGASSRAIHLHAVIAVDDRSEQD